VPVVRYSPDLHFRFLVVDCLHRFMIDKFHLLGHKAKSCSIGFAPQRSQSLAALNDSVCEQFHSFIVSGKPHFASMGQVRFMFTVEVSHIHSTSHPP
jgi:hypothetical protein